MTKSAKNILFIMFDQLRFDYLSCAGHPTLQTPNIDRIASQGVRFTRTYVQSPQCGSSRMSFYTGRYVHSHGAHRNGFPLKVGEITLGDHLRARGMDAYLVGKTHMTVDAEGMERLGLVPDSIIGARVAECGFDVVIRDDGNWAEGIDGYYDEGRSPYNEYLKSKGYEAENPWNVFANSSVDQNGDILSGWLMKNADQPANIREEDSETPWLTRECIRFLEERKSDPKPWLVHLSYIKPHWPYIVPAPYNDMYGPDDVMPPNRDAAERDDPHPVFGAYMDNMISRGFSRDEVRNKAIPAYMGLIKQCDDQMGVLFDYLEKTGRMDDTMIVITSDHGDYLGDHWMGEKDLFHDCSAKIPLIVYDPSTAADATRGTTCDALVESIDLASTFVALAGGEVPDNILEGQSLMPFLHGKDPEVWREFAVSEFDFSPSPMAARLGLSPRDSRLFMIADKEWKFMHAEGGFRPMLFNLTDDPNELTDLGGDPAYEAVIDRMYERLGRWARRMSQRTTVTDKKIVASRGSQLRRGILLGLYDESDIESEFLVRYQGKAPSVLAEVAEQSDLDTGLYKLGNSRRSM